MTATWLNTMTAFSQLVSILKQQQRKNSDKPRYHFIRDLHDLLSNITSKAKNDIMLVGDFNEEFDADLKGITKIAHQFSLHNLFYKIIGDSKFNTHS